MRLSVLIWPLALALCGCGDQASEPPVTMLPGLYNITATGRPVIEITRGEKSDDLCLTVFETQEFATSPMRFATRKRDDCTETVEPRAGNLVTGQRICSEGQGDEDDSVWTYRTEISEGGFVIKGEIKDGKDGDGPNSGNFTIEGIRSGQCASSRLSDNRRPLGLGAEAQRQFPAYVSFEPARA